MADTPVVIDGALVSFDPLILKGDPGAAGQQGAAGSVGATTNLTMGTVTTVPNGQAASASLTGTAPNQILNLVLPAGPSSDWQATPTVPPNGIVRALSDSYGAGAGAGVGGNINHDTGLYSSVPAAGGALQFGGGSIVTWAYVNSDCRFTIGSVHAMGGLTPAQIQSELLPGLLAVGNPGDTVLIIAGVNNPSQASIVIEMHESVRQAGMFSVAFTIPPNGTSISSETSDTIFQFNETMKAYAESNGIPIVDLYSLFADPTTGGWLSQYNGDGGHPNEQGFHDGGALVADVIGPLMPNAISLVGLNSVPANLTNVGLLQLQTKPLALGSPTLNTDYFNLSGIGSGSWGPASVSDFRGGMGYVGTVGDTTLQVALGIPNAPAGDLVAGHRYRIGMALEVALGTDGFWAVWTESATTGLHQMWGVGYSTTISVDQSLTSFYSDVVYTGSNDQFRLLRIYLGGAGSVIKIGQFTYMDLTLAQGG